MTLPHGTFEKTPSKFVGVLVNISKEEIRDKCRLDFRSGDTSLIVNLFPEGVDLKIGKIYSVVFDEDGAWAKKMS